MLSRILRLSIDWNSFKFLRFARYKHVHPHQIKKRYTRIRTATTKMTGNIFRHTVIENYLIWDGPMHTKNLKFLTDRNIEKKFTLVQFKEVS